MEKEKIETRRQIVFLIIGIITIFVLLYFVGINMDNEINKRNWWTEVLCLQEDGEYIENVYFDTCIIEGVEYLAKFRKSGEYYNNTKLGERSEWQLIRKR